MKRIPFHNIPFRAITLSTRAGEDPDAVDDASEVYADNVIPLFPEIDTPCEISPNGQCEYSWRDKFATCIHCKQKSGLDQ